MLPPGRAKLEMRPVPTGSPAGAMTIGISVVACLAAVTAGVCEATMMSTLSRTSSSASPRRQIWLSFCRAELELDGLPLDIAMLAQPLLELAPERLWVCRDENANSGQLGLLRARRERPRSR